MILRWFTEQPAHQPTHQRGLNWHEHVHISSVCAWEERYMCGPIRLHNRATECIPPEDLEDYLRPALGRVGAVAHLERIVPYNAGILLSGLVCVLGNAHFQTLSFTGLLTVIFCQVSPLTKSYFTQRPPLSALRSPKSIWPEM